MISSSSFRALQGQRVRLYLSILRSLVWFRFFRGFFLFVYSHLFFSSVTLSFSFRRLFGAGQSTARVSLVVVMSSPASANTAPLEPNVVIANEVYNAVEVDDTDQAEFDLDELKEQLGIDSILEKSNDLSAKFCSAKTIGLSTLVQRLKIQGPLQKPPKGFLTPRPQ